MLDRGIRVNGSTTNTLVDRATQKWVPDVTIQYIHRGIINLVQGRQPKELKCDHGLLEQNPTIRSDFIEKTKTGIINLHRASVNSLTPTGLSLSTGVDVDADVIISCTGYHMTDMPFLPEGASVSREAPAPHIDLYKRFISPWYDNLFVIGRVENFGPLAPAAEAQTRVAAAIVSGRLARPEHGEMMASIRNARKMNAKKFINSDRHLYTVHAVEYIDDVLRPLGAVPTVPNMLGRARNGKRRQAVRVLLAVYFGMPSSGQWRLVGEGNNEKLAEATVLRIAQGKKELSEGEKEALGGGASAKDINRSESEVLDKGVSVEGLGMEKKVPEGGVPAKNVL